MLNLQRLRRRVASRLRPILQSDGDFIESAYREILGRPVDEDGFRHYKTLLQDGLDRTALILALVRSDEFLSRLKEPTSSTLVDLRLIRPERYSEAVDLTNGQRLLVFDAVQSSDFDWLEHMITQTKYYEKPGVWNFGVDTDKRLMAEIASHFRPHSSLELGCASGAVLECLRDLGIVGEGVDISEMALERASARVRPTIHIGDLLALDLPTKYDLVIGLDIFEHLNPNRIDSYLGRIAQITRAPAFLFCNIPAFGCDAVFGTVFPYYLDRWEAEAAIGKHFSRLHADQLGYPLHGHLISADSSWWVRRFEAAGFHRENAIEEMLHRKYDTYLDKRSKARKAFYIFSKGTSTEHKQRVMSEISKASLVLS